MRETNAHVVGEGEGQEYRGGEVCGIMRRRERSVAAEYACLKRESVHLETERGEEDECAYRASASGRALYIHVSYSTIHSRLLLHYTFTSLCAPRLLSPYAFSHTLPSHTLFLSCARAPS